MTAPAAAHHDVAASALLTASPQTIFGFLSDLENHVSLAPGSVQLLSLDRLDGKTTGAFVRLRGPLRIGRLASTAMSEAPRSGSICGRANIGARTQASVLWTIDPDPLGATVELRVIVESTGLLDGILLALGGRRWLRRRLASALETLNEQLAAFPVAKGATRSPERLAGLYTRAALEGS